MLQVNCDQWASVEIWLVAVIQSLSLKTPGLGCNGRDEKQVLAQEHNISLNTAEITYAATKS